MSLSKDFKFGTDKSAIFFAKTLPDKETVMELDRKSLNRRHFIKLVVLTNLFLTVGENLLAKSKLAKPNNKRPNILWLTCEDLSPSMIGCYGNAKAHTPNIDKLASSGVRFKQVFASAPVCSPARSCLITGTVATATGTQNLRTEYALPAHIHGFPMYMRRAGYFCTNAGKTDYNTKDAQCLIEESWDRNGIKLDYWRDLEHGQPFFSVINFACTHQSAGGFIDQEFKPLAKKIHKPSEMPVAPYYPDTPTVRRTLAHYYDRVTQMDAQIGNVLKQLEEDGLADDTIVFFYSDHGTGLPRHKRQIYDTGLKVPFIVRFGKNFKHLSPVAPGQTTDRLVSFEDLAPTMLSITDKNAPDYIKGNIFLGPKADPPRKYVYGARDRLAEELHMSRTVRDQRYRYIRNYNPSVPWGYPETYSDMAPMRAELLQLAKDGKLNKIQKIYTNPKPAEELFDTQKDPYEINNLVDDPAYGKILNRLRTELRRWMLDIRDAGFMPEKEFRKATENHSSPWDLAQDENVYPLSKVLDAAELVGEPNAQSRQAKLLTDPVPSVRFWAAQGLYEAGEKARPYLPDLKKGLNDPQPSVRIYAAGAVLNIEESTQAFDVLSNTLLPDKSYVFAAARILQVMGERARPALPAVIKLYRAKKEDHWSDYATIQVLKTLGEWPLEK